MLSTSNLTRTCLFAELKMDYRCMICAAECKLRKGKTLPAQLEQWQQDCPKKMDEDGLSWIFNLDLKGYDMIRIRPATKLLVTSNHHTTIQGSFGHRHQDNLARTPGT